MYFTASFKMSSLVQRLPSDVRVWVFNARKVMSGPCPSILTGLRNSAAVFYKMMQLQLSSVVYSRSGAAACVAHRSEDDLHVGCRARGRWPWWAACAHSTLEFSSGSICLFHLLYRKRNSYFYLAGIIG